MSGSVLRSDVEVALSEVYRCARHAATTCARSAERVEGELAGDLSELAALCERAAERARRELEAVTDEPPSEPDPDREDLESLVRAAKTALSPHPADTLAQGALAAIDELAAASAEARELRELPADARAWLTELAGALARAAERLRRPAA